jgi:hypothetical protein
MAQKKMSGTDPEAYANWFKATQANAKDMLPIMARKETLERAAPETNLGAYSISDEDQPRYQEALARFRKNEKRDAFMKIGGTVTDIAERVAKQEHEQLQVAFDEMEVRKKGIGIGDDLNKALLAMTGVSQEVAPSLESLHKSVQNATQWFESVTGGNLKKLIPSLNVSKEGIVSGKDSTGRTIMVNIEGLARKLSPEERESVLAEIKNELNKDVHKVRARG